MVNTTSPTGWVKTSSLPSRVNLLEKTTSTFPVFSGDVAILFRRNPPIRHADTSAIIQLPGLDNSRASLLSYHKY